jgi:hypothetical protein
MRTTLSLDDDVAAQLDQIRARADQPFKQLVNDLLRAGLAQLDHERTIRAAGPYTRPVSLGRPRLPGVDDVSETLAMAEGELYG